MTSEVFELQLTFCIYYLRDELGKLALRISRRPYTHRLEVQHIAASEMFQSVVRYGGDGLFFLRRNCVQVGPYTFEIWFDGTATLTHRFVEVVKPYDCLVLDTRKTTPCLRVFEKFAVRCGGGANHRFGLYDRILMKDNHRRLWAGGDPNRLDLAVEAARKAYPLLAVEIEVESKAELESALRAEPEWIMLDNMPLDLMRECVSIVRASGKKTKLEASGGINLQTANAIASTGVDALSVGALTHSAPSVDLALEWSAI